MSDHLGLSLDKPVEVIQHWRCIDCQHETITIVTMMALDWVLLCHSDPDRRRVSFIGGFFERHWYEEYVCEDCLQKRSEDAQAQQELLHPPVPQLEPLGVRLRRSARSLFTRLFH